MRGILSTTGRITAGETGKRGTSDAPVNAKEISAADAARAERPVSMARKLALLRRGGLFGGDTKGAVIERACSLHDLREAYRLVHSVYVGTGFIGAEPAGVRLRVFEMSSETATFVAKFEGRVVGVLSIVSDSSDLGLPSDSAFKPELDALRATGAKLCEVTNQAVAEEFRKSAVATELMRCAFALMMHNGLTTAFVSVSPSHQGFYDLLTFKKLGSERSYSEKLHDPVIALAGNLQRYLAAPPAADSTERFIYDHMIVQNPFVARIADWGKQAKREFLNFDLLEELFVKDRNFLSECSASHLKAIQRRWGQEMFFAVSGGDYLPEEASPAVPSPSPKRFVHCEPLPDSMVIFAGEIYAFFSAVLDRVAKLFSTGIADAAKTKPWDSLNENLSGGRTDLAVANTPHDVTW